MSDYIYLPEKNVYLTPDGSTYTDEEIDALNKMEREWKRKLKSTLPKNFAGWLQVFPEAIKPARRGLKAKLKQYKKELSAINEQQEDYYDVVIAPAHFSEQAEIKADSDKDFDEMRKKVGSKIKKVMFDLSFLDELEGKGDARIGSGISAMDIEKAKEVPIETFFVDHLHRHGKLAVGKCPLHTEKTGSFTIYTEQNSWWCYGCNKGGSVVDFIMQQEGVDFLTAVKKLLK